MSDLDLLTQAAVASGEIAKSHLGSDLGVTLKAADNSPVTRADLAVNAYLEDTLQTARPDYGWLSEESADTASRLSADKVFIIDPIDGTRSFIEGSNTWAHSLAIAERGQITAAVVYLPMRDKLYVAAKGQGARLNDRALTISGQLDIDTAHVLAAKPSLSPPLWAGNVPSFKRGHRPSLAYRLSLVAEGRFDAMFTFRGSWEWDIAAGSLIVEEAGGRMSDKTGGGLIYNQPHPQFDGVVSANALLHDAILNRLSLLSSLA